MLFKEIIAVHSDNHTKHKMLELLIIKAAVTCKNHSFLKGCMFQSLETIKRITTGLQNPVLKPLL
jgi:hypothetical protein